MIGMPITVAKKSYRLCNNLLIKYQRKRDVGYSRVLRSSCVFGTAIGRNICGSPWLHETSNLSLKINSPGHPDRHGAWWWHGPQIPTWTQLWPNYKFLIPCNTYFIEDLSLNYDSHTKLFPSDFSYILSTVTVKSIFHQRSCLEGIKNVSILLEKWYCSIQSNLLKTVISTVGVTCLNFANNIERDFTLKHRDLALQSYLLGNI